MDMIGMRGTIALSIVGYVIYVATNAFGNWDSLMAGGVVQGLVQGPVWTASACYIRAVGLERTRITGEDEDRIITKFFSIYFLMYQLGK